MVNRILQKQRALNQNESGVAMMIAVLMILVMVGLITFMVSFGMRSIEKGTSVQNLNASLNAADTAIANMMTVANGAKNKKGLEFDKYLGVNNAAFGSFQANEVDPTSGDGQYSWRWYAEKEINSSVGTTYTVYATGYKNTPDEKDARTVKVKISSSTVEEIVYDASGIRYIATHAGSFGFNAFGNTVVDMGRDTSAKVYDSNKNLGYPADISSLGAGEIATNNSFKIDTGVYTNATYLNPMVNASQYQSSCAGPGCASNTFSNYQYSLSLAATRKQALVNCPNASYPDWIASQKAGKISGTPSVQCYNNIVFDTDTALDASISTGNAVKIYAKGNITVKPGIEVARQVRTSQGPLALQLVSSGTSNFLMERGTTADPTKFTGTVVGEGLTCNIGGDSASTTLHGTALYGSVACNNVKLQRDSTIWWDEQLAKTLKEGSPTAVKIWTAQSYEEL